MRRFGLGQALAVLLVATACGQNGTSPSSSTTDSSVAEPQVNPAKISRVRGDLPAGYEVADVGGPASPVTFDPVALGKCGQWTVSSGNTTGTVNLVDAPAIEGATTVGMDTVAKTVVEGGTETTSVAYTFSAYIGDYLVFVTVVTDPGSPNPPLGQEFAADLLVKTVSALRG